MTYFFVEAYHDDYGDYEFQVFTENKEDVERLILENDFDETVKIYQIHGPYVIKPNSVLCTKEPS